MSNSIKHIAIFCNTNAGNGHSLLIAKTITGILQNKKMAFSIFIKEWPDVSNDFTEAWIVGGDGTLNYFINRYPEINIPLTIFKGGTGNDFANFMYPESDC